MAKMDERAEVRSEKQAELFLDMKVLVCYIVIDFVIAMKWEYMNGDKKRSEAHICNP